MTVEEWTMLEKVAPVMVWLSHPEIVENSLKYIRAEKKRIKSPKTFRVWTESYLLGAKHDSQNISKEEAEEKAKQLQQRAYKEVEFIEGIFKDAQKGKIPTAKELLTVYTQPCPFNETLHCDKTLRCLISSL